MLTKERSTFYSRAWTCCGRWWRENRRGSKDRRVVNLAITDAGRLMIKDAPVPIQSRLAENLNKLPLDEVEKLTAGLERLINLMQYDEASTEITRAASESEVF